MDCGILKKQVYACMSRDKCGNYVVYVQKVCFRGTCVYRHSQSWKFNDTVLEVYLKYSWELALSSGGPLVESLWFYVCRTKSPEFSPQSSEYKAKRNGLPTEMRLFNSQIL